MNKKISGVIPAAVLIEAIITYSKQFFVQGRFCWQMLVSIILGIVISIAYNLDLPEQFELKARIPYVGPIITGVLLARGSNYLFDLLKQLSAN